MLPDGRIVPDAATNLPAQYDYAGTTIPLSQDQGWLLLPLWIQNS